VLYVDLSAKTYCQYCERVVGRKSERAAWQKKNVSFAVRWTESLCWKYLCRCQ